MSNENSNKEHFNPIGFITEFVRLHAKFYENRVPWIGKQQDPEDFLKIFFDLANSIADPNAESVKFCTHEEFHDGLHGIVTKFTYSCGGSGSDPDCDSREGDNICKCEPRIVTENDFVLRPTIVTDQHAEETLNIQDVLDKYFTNCRIPTPMGGGEAHPCERCEKKRNVLEQVSIEPTQQFVIMRVKDVIGEIVDKRRPVTLNKKAIKFADQVITMPTASDGAEENWTLKGVLVYRGNIHGMQGHYYYIDDKGVYDDTTIIKDRHRMNTFMRCGFDQPHEDTNKRYAHSYLFQRVSDTNFKKHYDKHGWAISDYVFDSESEADNVLKKLLNVYERTSVKGLLTWSTTAGNGTRAWASVDGIDIIEKVFVPKIRGASQGLITDEYKKDKVAFLKGGQGIQLPHYDGDPSSKKDCNAAVSVNYACYEASYFVVYDNDSIKEIENGKVSIDYKRVHVPKGKAIYFDAYRCLHGGDDYSRTEIERNVFGTEHLRLFSRFIVGASRTDFYPPRHFDMYICTDGTDV
jgi:hypothetical protein